MELDLIKSPNYNSGGVVTDAVAGLTQTLFEVQRFDSKVTSILMETANTQMRLFFSPALLVAPDIGSFAYINITSPDDTKTFRGKVIIETTGTSNIRVDIVYTGVNTYTGQINFIDQGIVNVEALFSVIQGTLPASLIKYAIPYNIDTFKFDIHAFLEPIFNQFSINAFPYTVAISAISNQGQAVTGTAIGTFDVENFRAHLPQGYNYGQNLVGVIINNIIPGRFLTDVINGRQVEGFNPILAFYTESNVSETLTLKIVWLNVNGLQTNTQQDTFDTAYGLNYWELGIGLAPIDNAKYGTFQLFNAAEEAVTEIMSLQIYCPLSEPIRLQWRSRLGALDFWVFDRVVNGELDYTNGIAYHNTELQSLETPTGNINRFGAGKKQKYILQTRNLSLETYQELSQIFQSEFVEIALDVKGENSFPVTIISGFSNSFTTDNKINYSFTLQIELPVNTVNVLNEINYGL